MLLPQVRLFEKIISLGVKPENIFVVPKVYSANDFVIREISNLGCFILEDIFFEKNVSFDKTH